MYEIVRLLGRGGMGAVYEARHTGLDKQVALKVLASQYAASAEARERFQREGRAASRIRHPHIVGVSDLGISDGAPFLVMEYLEGEDLAQVLEREGRLSPSRIAEIMLPVLSAVQAAHDQEIVHRDLKPENIFLARTSLGVDPKVLDFGIAKLGGGEKALTGTAVMMGTVYYMSPEQVRSTSQAGPPSDQFSLGVILYQCVTGQRPFEADHVIGVIHAISTGEFVRPRLVRPDVPEAFEALVLRAMMTRPADRFPSARELGRALLAFADEDVRVRWGRSYGESTGRHSAVAPDPGLMETAVAAKTGPIPGGVPRAPASPMVASAASTLGPAGGSVAPLPIQSRGPLLIGAGVMATLVVGGAALAFWGGGAPADPEALPAQPTVHVTASPDNAAFALDGRALGHGAVDLALPDDGEAHRLVVSAEGFESRTIDLASGPPPERIELAPRATPRPTEVGVGTTQVPVAPAEVAIVPVEVRDETATTVETVERSRPLQPPSTSRRTARPAGSEPVEARGATGSQAPAAMSPPEATDRGANGALIIE